MVQGGQGQQGVMLTPWEPQRVIRKIDPQEVRYSRGFARSRPEKWFPGFAAHWLPLAHSLGVELKVTEVRPVISVPRNFSAGFAGTVDDEPVAVFTDDESLETILEAVSPGIAQKATDVVAEYMARRFLGSLAISWSGPEGSVVRFNTEIKPEEVSVAGAVKLSISLNGTQASVWLMMGRLLVDRLDGLWRRQVRSTAKIPPNSVDLRLEIAQLAVPPSTLADYMRSGSIIDLEVPASDVITLRHTNKGWLPARLCSVNGHLGFEIIAGPVPSQTLPEGTTRLSIELGYVQFDGSLLAEMAQVGALWDTGMPLTDRVSLSISNEKVSEATLCVYEGRFAMSVD